MESTSLTALAQEQLDAARAARSGRAAVTLYGGHEHRLRQTVIALRAGTQVWNGRTGDHLTIPPQRHDLEALSDAAVLLTVAT